MRVPLLSLSFNKSTEVSLLTLPKGFLQTRKQYRVRVSLSAGMTMTMGFGFLFAVNG